MKKILFVTHSISTGGGVGKVFSILANQIADIYDITVLERGENNKIFPMPQSVKYLKPMFYYPERANELGLKNRFYTIRRVTQSMLLLFIPFYFHNKYVKENYDFEISFNYLYPSIIVGASHDKRSKKIMWIHGDVYDLDYHKYSFPHNILSFFHFLAQKKALKKADKIVAISKNTSQSILDLFPFCANKIVLISNGYDYSEMRMLSEAFTIQKNERIRFISIGRLDSNKNVQLQIKVMVMLFDCGIKNIELYTIGEGEERRNLESLAGKYLNDGIYILGFQKNPYPYIKSSDCLLITSKSEGFPTVAIEAMALGKPVLSTPVGGIDEIIQEGVNGLTFDYSPEDMAKKIHHFIINRNQYDPMTITQSVAKYTAEKWGENFNELINSICSKE